MPQINVMIKPASGLCNMRCKYCFYTDEMEKRSQASYGIMSMETLEHVIRELFDFTQEQCTIAFQGGEPTLAGLDFYRQCLAFEKKYNKKQIFVSHALQTNGYGLDESWCSFFAENNFLIGLSIDGVKASHDAYRKDSQGGDTYFHVLETAQRLKEAGAKFNVLTVVNSKTAPKIRKIYEKYKKQGFFWQQYIACLDPIGEKQGRQEYSLTPESYGRFLIELFELWDLDFKQGKPTYIRQFENYIGILLGQPPESCEQRGVCSFQNIVEADGSVYPCDFYVLDGYCLGNLNTDSFQVIEQRRKELRFVEDSINHTESCRTCPYFALCRGGCRRHREQPGTKVGENYFCKAYRMFFDACLPRMREIASCLGRR
ncbi:MAG: anaerobic sulfatase maturase [Lachnospiraceae bacterium]|jgi:uncharacterized protein|nr:anaerobic sulfatase maturase [Lachnospiraceae bacterium]